MFEKAERCIYGKNQILETVCQYRFPPILSIDTETPAAFQDAIRAVFPRYELRKEQPAPKVTALPGQAPTVEKQDPINNHCFLTLDGAFRINLTKNFIALSCTSYTRWENYAKMLDEPLAQFLRLYKPAVFDRVWLRYINAFSRKELDLTEYGWRDLISERYLGLMADEDLPEGGFTRCTTDTETSMPGGCQLKLHTGPGFVRGGTRNDQEVRFVVDLDLSMKGNVPLNMAAGALNTLHVQAYDVFRDVVTDTLHNAMEPEECRG